MQFVIHTPHTCVVFLIATLSVISEQSQRNSSSTHQLVKLIFNCCGSHYKWILIDERLVVLLCDLDLNWDLLIAANVCCLREWNCANYG